MPPTYPGMEQAKNKIQVGVTMAVAQKFYKILRFLEQFAISMETKFIFIVKWKL